MGCYGPGMTFARTCALDKERIKMALQGKLLCGESKNGFEYEDAPKEDCDAYILSAYDDCVYQARQSMASGRVVEKILKEMNVEIPFNKYYVAMNEETLKDFSSKEYIFESDDEEE